ncbi:E3 ubiquitin-protein ligase CCNB1IP1 [Paralichthys olivaceus]|uniref:E3 ubiquitin-protein ligase CCNB1IP1 n=1 Tax=Paralichthys olivaceus TaxID=8255 RepID=UPI00097D5D29|nr:PREDICTED: E3 ubiquitin-protein ligase CCNB1IP1 [Paralichthys olivaceus]XP_019951075.1 PREDICTED: E3 ubiquitin-protein ligase CCNB1IP1 [Paralichthys olivaceus]XP_019951076.1 PREDICTED: E3 ubiquitin-protein ligase CCNB1IP1 [Paralichthys olivaceus]XP_019951078.1 PREDICTED: E3 ubiquitin-protein ligase CCNB1IP1 [Paralichthys olivaceus]XP_019951079.1 PREDICTED: E3 ubiquitin-protein ligase CCNB1IP1 [Paralichthys olivaceus]
MSLCDDTLLCNFPKCRTKLSGFAWVTACSHVFCEQHGSGEFSRSPVSCPACSSALSGKLDIVRTELSPSEEYKAMVLAGLRPDIVLDISSRALAFWSYQVHQERMYQEYSLSRAESQLKQMEKVLNQQNQSRELELTAMRGEISSLKKVMEEYKRKYSEVSERLMERNRQYQKLQGLYDSLRLRNMVVGVGERDAQPQPGHHDFITGTARPATPQRSPEFHFMGSDVDSRFFSCLEADGAKTFFQFSSPTRERGRPFVKKH